MKRLSTLVLAACTGLAVLVPTQAHAGSYVRPDATGDVSSSKDDGPFVKTPSRAEGDVRSSAVSHAGRRVVIAVAYRQLSQTTQITGQIARLRTNKGLVRDVVIYAQPGAWGGRTSMEKPGGRRVKCRMGTRIDYVGDRVTVSIPRKCLGRPRWVRVGIGAVTFQDEVVFADDAMTNGALGNYPVLGPVVRRG
jgi:hypothetical protein